MEEWCVNPDFAKFFLKNISSADFDIADRSAWHSITDEAYGESDIVLTFRSSGQSIAVLVEDKIDAAPQPDQAKRYQFRADKMKSSGRFDQIFDILDNVEGVFIPWGCIKLFFARKHRSFGVYYTAARLRLYINYSIRHAGESDNRNEQQTSERDDDTAERLYA